MRDAIAKIPEGEWLETEDEDTPTLDRQDPLHPQDAKGSAQDVHRQPALAAEPDWAGLPDRVQEYKYFAYVTNYGRPLEEQFRFCVERSTLEANIKEYKADFDYDFLPCKEFGANKAYVAYVALARNLSIFFRLLTAPPTVNQWRMATFHARILRVCGNIKRHAGRWIITLPVWWPYKTVMESIIEACAALTPL